LLLNALARPDTALTCETASGRCSHSGSSSHPEERSADNKIKGLQVATATIKLVSRNEHINMNPSNTTHISYNLI
jgi:hypothetical protein